MRDFATDAIRGDVVKEIEHRLGFWGLLLLTTTLSITPLRRATGWNTLQSFRRMFGLFTFFYIFVHFMVYLALDRELIFDFAFGIGEIGKDIAKRPYITIGFTGFLLMVPLALTSTKGWIRRLGKRWVRLHSLVYLAALAGVVHFMWSVKADTLRPTVIGAVLVILLVARLVPRRAGGRGGNSGEMRGRDDARAFDAEPLTGGTMGGVTKYLVIGFLGIAVFVLVVRAPCACTPKPWAYRESIKLDLRNLVTAEEQYFDSNGQYTADTAALRYARSTNVSLEIALTDSGWSAVGRHALVADGRCGIHVGGAANPVRDTLEGAPVCEGPGFKRRPLWRRAQTL